MAVLLGLLLATGWKSRVQSVSLIRTNHWLGKDGFRTCKERGCGEVIHGSARGRLGYPCPPSGEEQSGLEETLISVVGGATYTRLSHVLTPAVCGLFCLGCSQPCLPFGKTWNVISSEKPSLTFLEN